MQRAAAAITRRGNFRSISVQMSKIKGFVKKP